jgi:methylase of polypeptide subunit release factors
MIHTFKKKKVIVTSMTIDMDMITSDFKKLKMYSQKEFRIQAVQLIETIASSLGLTSKTHEYSVISGGRENALFNHVLIQYSAPGILSTDSGLATAQAEIVDSITCEGNNHSTFGILLSDRIAFIRFNGTWIVRGPYEINKSAILNLIGALRGLKKKKLCEKELIKDFGPQSELTLKTIMTLYDNLDTTSPEVSSLFAGWMKTFLQMNGSRKENLCGLDTFYSPGKDCTRLLFCIHTYYVILIKMIAARTIYSYSSPTIKWVTELDGGEECEEFAKYMKDLEEGTLLKILGHFDKDYFSWYLDIFHHLSPVLKEVAQKLSDYEYTTPVLVPEETTDILKTLYQSLVPAPIRHNLGEYYTPDWLAQFLLDRMGYTKDAFESMAEISHDPENPLKLRLLDPACGSGTFLVEALKRLRAYAEENNLTKPMTDYIFNIAGIDCNPLAVLTCKINYLLCMGDLLVYKKRAFPVYCADSLTVRDKIFSDKADYVIGNPPWILWDNLPADYRKLTLKLWKDYNLFTLTASQARHGGGKKDIAILFTSVCIDKYLKDSGTFGFLITQSVFKTKGAGEGFRQFQLKDTYLKVVEVHDFADVNPFEGAYTRTAAIILKKGEKTEYPVTYMVWSGDQNSFPLHVTEMAAFPSDPANTLSPWITVPPHAVHIVKNVYGKNSYPVYEGINSGGANGVFWVKICGTDQISQKSHIPQCNIQVENVTEGMKKKVRKVKTLIEDFFVYPLIKSKHVGKWKVKGHGYTLQMQDPVRRVGINKEWVKEHFPKTYAYLKQFEDVLLHRAAYIKFMKSRNVPFYTMYNVGVYTYAPYKVVWNRMGSRIAACVISTIYDPYLGEKIVLPENVLAFIPTDTEDEAHYICSIMNSSMTDMILRAIAGGTKSFGTPRIVKDTIRIPSYEEDNELHKTLSALSRKAHKIAQENNDTRDVEGEIDKLVAVLYNMSEEELCTVKETLRAGR